MNTPISDNERDELCRQARATAQQAYAPYSNFRVGAAVLGAHGVYRGANVENASFGLALCAERSALSAAIASGDRAVRAIAIACIDGDAGRGLNELVPCGACRQWLAELAPDAIVLLCGRDESFTVADLMPLPFRISR